MDVDHKSLKTVAVVVPTQRSELFPEEEISLYHLVHFLGNFDKYLVGPESLNFYPPGFHRKPFPDEFFVSVQEYNRLMLNPCFYRSFADYKFILIYQLDALVFSNQLLEWCEADFDYIGPPWFQCSDTPWVSNARVGNGGFSLRKVDSFLKVMDSDQYWVQPETCWSSYCAENPPYLRYLNFPRKYLKYIKRFNNVRRELRQWHLQPDGARNEDLFWSDRAVWYYPDFKVAPFQIGLKFAFEVAPRQCFWLNQQQLPFGCHAWARYDRAFWEPYLLP